MILNSPSFCVDAVFLNTKARGGKAEILWKEFLQSSEAEQLKFQNAKIFDIAAVIDSKNLFALLTHWTQECIQQGCKNFVAAGGDGTVNMAVNVLLSFAKFGPTLGAVGLGSSNDFHKPFSSDKRSQIINLPCRLDFLSAFKHDLVEVTFSFQNEKSSQIVFVINSSVGFVAEANLFFNRQNRFLNFLKKISVNSAIMFAAVQEFFRFKPKKIEIKIEKNVLEKVNLINLGIVKNIHFAGDFRYDMPQSPDNGLLGVYLFGSLQGLNLSKQNISKLQILKTFFALLSGKFSSLPDTRFTQCRELSIYSTKPIALETDGEVRQITYAYFKILPREALLCP